MPNETYRPERKGKLQSGVDIFGQPPKRPGRPQLFALLANTETERKILTEYVEQTISHLAEIDRPMLAWFSEVGDTDTLEHEGMVKGLTVSESLDITPIGVVWKPEHQEQQSWRKIRQWMRLVDSNRKQAQTLRKQPDRAGVVVAEFGTRKALQARYDRMAGSTLPDARTDIEALADFVALQAAITIERDARVATGQTIKYPRYVRRSIWGRPIFQAQLKDIARTTNRAFEDVQKEARECLEELVPQVQAPHVAFSKAFFRKVCQLGYDDKLVYDETKMSEIREVALSRPTALVWTHKTHIDGPAMMTASHEASLPLVHLIGGNNMAFFGVGYLMRRAGAIFIRRKMESVVYKAVLQHYFSWLLEKRFPISWALEGTRSRNGKLMPPRFGILKYVVEAAAKEDMQDLTIIPISIYYDLIAELGDYAREQSGETKRKESLAWFAGYLRSLRKPLGRISLGIGEPVVIDTTTPEFNKAFEGGNEQFSIELQKLAFEASVKANDVTPITTSSILALVLTGAAPRSLTEEECISEMWAIRNWAVERGLPLTDELQDVDQEKIRDVARAMREIGVVTRYEGGVDFVYSIADGKHFEASYYRNNSIHFFVNKAIIEVALMKASAQNVTTPLETFWDEIIALRDVFKFEFFYPEIDIFKADIEAELTRIDVNWRTRILAGQAGDILRDMDLLVAHSVLRPFAEAYSVIADVMYAEDGVSALDENDIVASALKLGKQAYLQRRISSEESIGKLMFSNGYKLATNRGLVWGGKDMKAARQGFVRELNGITRRLRQISEIAANKSFDPGEGSRATFLSVVGKS